MNLILCQNILQSKICKFSYLKKLSLTFGRDTMRGGLYQCQFFFLSGFSFKNTGDSQNSSGRMGIIFITPYHFHQLTNIQTFITACKVSKYGIFCGPCFLVFGLNAEIYEVKNSLFGHFSCSVFAILHVRSLSHILIVPFVTIRLLFDTGN